MHIPDLELTAYLGVFLTPKAVDEALDRVALRALDGEAQDQLDLYVLAHQELVAMARVSPDVELDVLTDEGGLGEADAREMLQRAGVAVARDAQIHEPPIPGGPADHAEPPPPAAEPARQPRQLRAAVELPPRRRALDVRVRHIHHARRINVPDSAVTVLEPTAELAMVDAQMLPREAEGDEIGPHRYPVVSHRPSKPLIPRWVIVVAAVALVTWLGIALLSDAGRARLALLGLNPVLLLVGVGGPMLAGYAFLRAGDALGDVRDVSADETEGDGSAVTARTTSDEQAPPSP